MSAIQNRIEKNYRKLKPWSDRNRFEAFRLYDRDIPEFPYIIDLYKNYALVYDRSDSFLDAGKNHLEPTTLAIQAVLGEKITEIIFKKRVRQEGEQQYEKLSTIDREILIQENQFKYRVNLWDYLDTGLFLDHRPSRYKIFKASQNAKFLNLFCYTGSVSVAAALGGAQVTSVDLSKTYLDWAVRNFESNEIDLKNHTFIQADVLQFFEESSQSTPEKFDLIFLDPPTFSNSKRMLDVLDTQRDHAKLVRQCMQILKPQGLLIFTTNKRKFKLEPELKSEFRITETTKNTIPLDFHDQQIHSSFEIRKL
jgi:23S rRNA (cytosine1962-C5)-methyltransferase/23S rRNA (guanine2445-N2)-methyltransferase / 23S rRNA (guanine2069-N7)-methyltransferase